MAASTIDPGRVAAFQLHIDDMRNSIMCKICFKPLYEPFILACGHTYCYGCLRSWFSGLDSRKRKKNCPDCRDEVKLVPSPNYILRDLVHMFVSRIELLPEDETVEEHAVDKLTEAELLASDRNGPGLFQGVFRTRFYPHFGFGPLHDISDEVYRCPQCHWELEDGTCGQCGYEAMEDDDYPDFSDEEDEESIMGDETIASDSMSNGSGHDTLHALPHHFYGAHALSHLNPNLNSDVYSDLEYDTPTTYTHEDHEDDGDEIDSFIDDHDDDEPDEVDEDDMNGPLIGYMPRARSRQYRIPDDDDGDEEDNDDDDENEDNDEPQTSSHDHRVHQEEGWRANVPQGEIDESDAHEENSSGDEESNQDQQTNYDESDDESQLATPIAGARPWRRRPIVISDDEDEDESEDADEDQEDDEESDGESDVDNQQQEPSSEALDHVSDSDSDSDDTAIPPQPSAYRRQRLDNHRKRRRTRSPDDWRALARGRGERTDHRRGSRSRNNEMRQIRPGNHYLTVPS